MLENLKVSELLEIMELFKGNNKQVKKYNINDYYIVRTYSAGVFAGHIVERNGKEVIMKNARRLWEWSGAASLSQLSQEGVKNPDECKFPCEIPHLELTEAVEISKCTDEARQSMANVPVWKA